MDYGHRLKTARLFTDKELSKEEAIRLLRQEQRYINERIKKIEKRGLYSSASMAYKKFPIKTSKTMSMEELRKETLKARRFHLEASSTIEGAELYTAQREASINAVADALDNEVIIQGAYDLAIDAYNLYEDIVSEFPLYLRKVLESDQFEETVNEEYRNAISERGVDYDELRQRLYNIAYDTVGDFFAYKKSIKSKFSE